MIKASVLVDNKSWKKYISDPNIFLKKKLKKTEKKNRYIQKK